MGLDDHGPLARQEAGRPALALNHKAPLTSIAETKASPGGNEDKGNYCPWLHRYAMLTALATLGLLGIGGLVTSHGVGMAVPDWPTTYGYNMFFFPVSQWIGGIFYEHTHRLVASAVGLLVVGLTRWLGGRSARLPLAVIGLSEVVAGLLLLRLGAQWHGAGHFLSGIGGVVVLAAAIWARGAPAPRPLPACGWLAFWLVQVQGLLGGLRVVLFKDQIGIFHGALAQVFFVLLCAIALFTSRWWQKQSRRTLVEVQTKHPPGVFPARVIPLFLLTTFLVLAQLVLGATMRHQHAGLAIPDFPTAYGRLWPAMDAASVVAYNQHRIEITALNPITAFQIGLQMAHRLLALAILLAVTWSATAARRVLGWKHPVTKLSFGWLGLILAQVALGAATIWSNKAADIATAHVVVGALALATGALICLVGRKYLLPVKEVFHPQNSRSQVVPDSALGLLSGLGSGHSSLVNCNDK